MTRESAAKFCVTCGAQLLGNEALGQRCNNCLDNPPLFVALRRVVMQGDKRICEATSSTLARRIANALNRYTPTRKGY